MTKELGVPYSSPVSPDSYGFLAVALLLVGMTVMSVFFTKAVAPKKQFIVELVLAVVAALFLGFGSLFLFLWAEIYV